MSLAILRMRDRSGQSTGQRSFAAWRIRVSQAHIGRDEIPNSLLQHLELGKASFSLGKSAVHICPSLDSANQRARKHLEVLIPSC